MDRCEVCGSVLSPHGRMTVNAQGSVCVVPCAGVCSDACCLQRATNVDFENTSPEDVEAACDLYDRLIEGGDR